MLSGESNLPFLSITYIGIAEKSRIFRILRKNPGISVEKSSGWL